MPILDYLQYLCDSLQLTKYKPSKEIKKKMKMKKNFQEETFKNKQLYKKLKVVNFYVVIYIVVILLQ